MDYWAVVAGRQDLPLVPAQVVVWAEAGFEAAVQMVELALVLDSLEPKDSEKLAMDQQPALRAAVVWADLGLAGRPMAPEDSQILDVLNYMYYSMSGFTKMCLCQVVTRTSIFRRLHASVQISFVRAPAGTEEF